MSIFIPAVINPPQLFYPYVAWNPADASTGVNTPTLSNLNRTVLGSSVIRATQSRTTGKYYFEVKIDVLGNGSSVPYIAIVSNAKTCDQLKASFGPFGVGNDIGVFQNSPPSTGHKYYSTGNVFGGAAGAVVTGDVYGIAVDLTAGNFWSHRNGTYDSGNPSLGTSPGVTGLTGTWFPVVNLGGTGIGTTDQLTGNFTRADMLYTVPTNFTAWNGT